MPSRNCPYTILRTRNDAGTKGNVLARHLIQSFLPGETTSEMAHRIGLELCKKILNDEYEFVLSTHIDKGHIHNHIIFNNVNMVTGRCYQSNKKNYHQIRYQNDKLCKENGLSVIDEYYERFKKKYKTNGKSWYENEQAKNGTSWKSKLQFDIDRMIKQSKDWNVFLKKMADLDYETKYGKHIAFKHKDKERFTRAKTIGEDYTEDRLKERILDNANQRTYPVKKRVGNIIDIANNEKIATLSATMEQVHTVTKYRQIYQAYKKEQTDRAFAGEHKAEILLYEKALANLKKSYSKMPNSKQIFEELEKLNEKKNTLMQEYFSSKSEMTELYQIRKNYEKYIGKEMER